MEFNRPKIKLKLTSLDLWLDRLAFAGMIVLWLYTLLNYNALPRIIPIHYNLSGEIDGYGNKLTILMGPFIATFIACGLSLLNKYPHIFNYPSTLTEENAERQYMLATRLLRFIKLSVVCIFLYTNITIIHNARTNVSPMYGWDLPLILLAIIAPVTWYFIKANKK